jgi:hypothetical protein
MTVKRMSQHVQSASGSDAGPGVREDGSQAGVRDSENMEGGRGVDGVVTIVGAEGGGGGRIRGQGDLELTEPIRRRPLPLFSSYELREEIFVAHFMSYKLLSLKGRNRCPASSSTCAIPTRGFVDLMMPR